MDVLHMLLLAILGYVTGRFQYFRNLAEARSVVIEDLKKERSEWKVKYLTLVERTMRSSGRVVPEDEEFEPFALTNEYEIEVQQARNRKHREQEIAPEDII